MTFTVEQIARAAELATYYVRPDDLWLRILYVEPSEGYLQGLDEDRGDEYAVIFEQEHIAVFARASLKFKHLVAAELRQHIARAALLDPDEIAVYHPARGTLPAL